VNRPEIVSPICWAGEQPRPGLDSLALYRTNDFANRSRCSFEAREKSGKSGLEISRNVFPPGHTIPIRDQNGELNTRNCPTFSTCRPPPETQGESQPDRYTCLVAGRPALASSARVGSTFPSRGNTSQQPTLTPCYAFCRTSRAPRTALSPAMPRTMRRPYLRSLRKDRGWRRCEHTVLGVRRASQCRQRSPTTH